MATSSSPARSVKPSRALSIALWIAQVLCAAMFLFAGGPKLAGHPQMVETFDVIGFGQWFRYFTAALEVLGGIALLVPATAPFAAIVLACVMAGAVLTHLVLIPGSIVPALVLMVLCLFIAWGRRARVQALLSR
jgi:putative oxidoreductase